MNDRNLSLFLEVFEGEAEGFHNRSVELKGAIGTMVEWYGTFDSSEITIDTGYQEALIFLHKKTRNDECGKMYKFNLAEILDLARIGAEEKLARKNGWR